MGLLSSWPLGVALSLISLALCFACSLAVSLPMGTRPRRIELMAVTVVVLGIWLLAVVARFTLGAT